MKFLKTIFAGRKGELKLSSDFPAHVEKAIQVLTNADSDLNDEQFLQLLINAGINKYEAIEIFLFLPISFARYWLTDVNWPDSYIEYLSEKKQIKKEFSTTNSYQVISRVTEHYFRNTPDKTAILKIGSRSSEFDAINQLLRDNPKARLTDIEISPTIIIR